MAESVDRCARKVLAEGLRKLASLSRGKPRLTRSAGIVFCEAVRRALIAADAASGQLNAQKIRDESDVAISMVVEEAKAPDSMAHENVSAPFFI